LLDDLIETKKVIYNIGHLDYEVSAHEYLVSNFIKNKPNVINLIFKRGNSVIVTDGGVTAEMNIENIGIESSFVSCNNNENWHKKYNGFLGYVISNSPVSDNNPDFYHYSCRIGTKYNENMKIFAQEIETNGIKNTIIL